MNLRVKRDRESLVKPIVPIVKERRSLEMEEGTYYVWRKTVISMQEDPHKHGGRQLCIFIKGRPGKTPNRRKMTLYHYCKTSEP